MLVLAVLLSAAESGAWVTRIAGAVGIADQVREIAASPSGDLLAASTAGVVAYAGGSGQVRWRVDFPPPGPIVPYYAIAADPRGDALVLEVRCCGAPSDGWSVTKRSGASGRALWQHDGWPELRAPHGPYADAAGDVFVVGEVLGSSGTRDLGVLKLDGRTGRETWRVVLPLSGPHVVTAAAVDAAGDVVVAGYRDGVLGQSAVVTKVAGSDGAVRWRASFELRTRLEDIGCDAAGDVLVAGSARPQASGDEVVLAAKLARTTGAVRWRDTSVAGSGSALDVDAEDGLVVTGREQRTDVGDDIVTARWRADGTLAWQRQSSGTGRSFDYARDVAIVDGTVLVGGSFGSGSQPDAVLLGLALEDGTERWRRVTESDPDVLGGGGLWRVVDAGGASAFISGFVATESTLADAVLARIAAEDGHDAWRIVINDTTEKSDEEAVTLALDPRGDLIACGTIGSPETGVAVGAVKLSAADGHEIWRAPVDELRARVGDGGGVVDGAGDVVLIGGVTTGPPTPSGGPFTPGGPAPVTLAVVKLSGVDGGEQWRYVHAPGDGNELVGTLATDAAGDVVASTWRADVPGTDVVKLDGRDGTLLWRTTLPGPALPAIPASLGVDPAGDVLAVVGSDGAIPELVVLSGADGSVLRRAKQIGWYSVDALVIDPLGDVLTAGRESSTARKLVRKTYAGIDGGGWTTSLGVGAVRDAALDAHGDVLVAGTESVAGADPAEPVLAVTKLDGASGVPTWEYLSPLGMGGEGFAVVADAAGDVLVGGRRDVAGAARFAVLKLDGVLGTVRWQTTLSGGSIARADAARDVVLDGAGRVAAAGSLATEATGLDFAVVSLDAATGSGASCRFARGCGGKPVLTFPTIGNGRLPRR
ncbi:PQQ-like beta-propeller repeat protein [Candidatus Binatia bacterium]|nr:PQQ-like beta-propeller repeat protein [Candidatus Binatia bacterium]